MISLLAVIMLPQDPRSSVRLVSRLLYWLLILPSGSLIVCFTRPERNVIFHVMVSNIIDWLKFETRASSLRNLEIAYTFSFKT